MTDLQETWYPAADLNIPLPPECYGYPAGTRDQNQPIAVVHHIAEGYFSTLTDPGFWLSRGSSVHFAVAKDGRVAQLVAIDNAAWGNGRVQHPTWPLLTPTNPNLYTVSIEHEGFTGDPWPIAQVDASIELTRWVCDVAGIDPSANTIIGHYRIDGVSRANCPGTGWPIDTILYQLQHAQGAIFTPAELATIRRTARHQARLILQEHRRNGTHLTTTQHVAYDATDGRDAG